MELRRNKAELFIYCVLLAAMVGATAVLLRQTDEEAKERNEIQQAFRSLLQLDMSLNENILRTRASLFGGYDELSGDVDRLYTACGDLMSSQSAFMRRAPTNMVTDLINFCDEVKAKTELTAKFKARSEELRSSMRSMADTVEVLDETPLESGSSRILALLLELTFSLSDGTQARLNQEIQELRRLSAGDSRFREIVRQVIANSESILEKTRGRDAMEKEILSGNIMAKLKGLEESYAALMIKQERVALFFRIGLIVLCAILLGSQLYLFRRLVVASMNLKKLNRTLESKVEQRTAALSDALSKLSEQQQILVQSTKMTALGEMAGGMAHEINTPLAAIMLNAELLQDQVEKPNPTEIAKLADAIIRVTQRISKIVIGLRKFSRNGQEDQRMAVSVREIVDDTLSFCREKFAKHDIQLSIDCSENHRVLCNPEQICQVLLNLLNNAYDAVQEKNPPKKWVRIESRAHEGMIEIRVTDCGDGIPKEVRSKMLEPFFTTKDVGKGTGLGLSISNGIIENHAGHFRYDEDCPNTSFIFSIPDADSADFLSH